MKSTLMYRIKKFYRGGSNTFTVTIDRKLYDECFGKDTNSFLEFIGENTNGGSESGYKVDAYRIYKIPKKYKCYEIKYEKVDMLVMASSPHKEGAKE